MAPEAATMPAVIGAGELWRYVEAIESAEKVRPKIAEVLQKRTPYTSAFFHSPTEVFIRELPEWFGTSERPDLRDYPAYGQLIDPFSIGMYLMWLESSFRGLFTRNNDDGFWDRFEEYRRNIFEAKWKRELRIEEDEEEEEEEDYNQYLQRLATEDQILRRAGFRPRYQLTEDGRIVRIGIEEIREERIRREAERARYEYGAGIRPYGLRVRETDFREYFERIYQLVQENPQAAELAYRITETLVYSGIIENVYRGFDVLENITRRENRRGG